MNKAGKTVITGERMKRKNDFHRYSDRFCILNEWLFLLGLSEFIEISGRNDERRAGIGAFAV